MRERDTYRNSVNKVQTQVPGGPGTSDAKGIRQVMTISHREMVKFHMCY